MLDEVKDAEYVQLEQEYKQLVELRHAELLNARKEHMRSKILCMRQELNLFADQKESQEDRNLMLINLIQELHTTELAGKILTMQNKIANDLQNDTQHIRDLALLDAVRSEFGDKMTDDIIELQMYLDSCRKSKEQAGQAGQTTQDGRTGQADLDLKTYLLRREIG
ncbi:MAG: hypothetical protein Faunusvirus11_24 [Faunusvirus sp.]|jgi:hypothetical protein|uniref:Uncharacterized protein n=1 Tax=Faunusvirus sp. TaxID=2487766 RepID=A0A3G4ZWW8_9VIRU|nr:MAG: hypothetical protein Faunusvirus11_24 [Faunusvirus sp.]